MATMTRPFRKRFAAGLALGAAIGLAGSAGCEKKKVDGGAPATATTPTTPTATPSTAPADAAPPAADEPADAAPPAGGALVLTEKGLGGVNAATPGTLEGVRAALPGLEIREAEIDAGEGETSRGFDVVRGGRVVAQVVLDDAGKVSFIDATGEGSDEAAAAAIRTSDGIAAGASFADVRKAGADQCEIVKTADDQIDDWPDATCLREGGHIRYELQIEPGAPSPAETGPVSSLRARVIRVLWFSDARHTVLR
jgi:hypothetical protein